MLVWWTNRSVTQVSAVCVHCKGFVEGCTGSAACPLATEITANGVAMEDPKTSKIPTVGYILPPDMLSHPYRSPFFSETPGTVCTYISKYITIIFTD